MNPFHHHHREDEDSSHHHHHPPPDHHPPPPYYYPPPPEIQHVSHDRGYPYDRPPEPYPPVIRPYIDASDSHLHHQHHHDHHHHDHHHHGHWPHHDAPPPRSYGAVEHVSHETGDGSRPRPRQQTFRIYTKAEDSFSLSIRNGQVVLARNDPHDEFQHWIKDMTYSTRVKDEEGFPAFSLINKVTGEAIKHSIGQGHPVRLIKYNPDYLDESLLWAESKDVGHGFRCIRMVNNIRLNFDAFHGDKDHGGVKDGTIVVLWEWWKGDNQKWRIVPH